MKRFFIVIFTILAIPAYGAENIESPIEAKYKLAIQHRDGKDSNMAKQLFLEVVSEMPNHTKALHNLGMLAHDEKSYEEARGYFEKGSGLGLKESSRNIWKMQVAQKIPASREERFFAICDLNEYAFPLDRKTFKFNMSMGEFENSGNMGTFTGLCCQTLSNSGHLASQII